MQVVDFYNNPNVGLFFYTTSEETVIPSITPGKIRTLIQAELNTELVECNTYESSVNNIFLTGNDEYLFAPSIITKKEEEMLSEIPNLELIMLDTKLNALGNNMCFAGGKVLINPEFEEGVVSKLEELGYEVGKGRVAGVNTVGANLVVIGDQGLINPEATSEEMENVKKVLSIDTSKGTVNKESNIVKAGLVVNENGVLVSNIMTGREMMNIEELFKNGFGKE